MTSVKICLCLVLAYCAIPRHVGVAGYQSNPKMQDQSPYVRMPAITQDDIEKAFVEAKKRIAAHKAIEDRMIKQGYIENRRTKKAESVFHNKKSTPIHNMRQAKKQEPFDEASDVLIKKYNLNSAQAEYGLPRLPLSSPSAAEARETCTAGGSIQCNRNSRFRTQNGVCNNLNNPTWGSAFSCFQRLLPAEYVGEAEFRRSVDGSALPEPRTLSLDIHRNVNRATDYVNHLYMGFGQLLDHDITFTPVTTVGNNVLLNCCPGESDVNHPQCAPISIGPNDPFYSRFGQRCMTFTRSVPCPFCTLGSRRQVNQVTAFIDASFVYDNLENSTNRLRTMDGTGRLRFQDVRFGPLLPPSDDPANDQCSVPAQNQICFLTGDARSNQHPILTSLHTVFMREHNRIAGELRRINSRWDEERLFQETRRILGAEMQMFTYNEYLPITLGKERMDFFRLWVSNGGRYTGYDPNVNPTLYTDFSTGPFRFGHTLVNSLIAETLPIPGHSGHLLRNVFFNPFGLYQGEVDPVLNGSTSSPAQFFDRYMVPDVTDFLYSVGPGQPGFDLAALNIQRGRDHGLPGYSAYVNFCSQREYQLRNFNDLLNFRLMTYETVQALRRNYRYVQDIDLFTGGICEIYMPGRVVGPTITCVLGLQFERLKFGDRFYFEHGRQTGSFSPAQLNELRKASLSKLFCDNTNIAAMPKNAMLFQSESNPRVRCEDLESIDLTKWRE